MYNLLKTFIYRLLVQKSCLLFFHALVGMCLMISELWFSFVLPMENTTEVFVRMSLFLSVILAHCQS